MKGLKLLCLSIWCCLQFQAAAQSFHVDDTSAVLVKTTAQSPAHWYIEVISDVATDTTLRWITHFSDIPSQWTINFDDQTMNHPVIVDNDSMDFVLHPLVDFPQKLIIGAMLNNTPGHGIVYFDLVNPANRTEFQTISYEFIVSAVAGLNPEDMPQWLTIANNQLVSSESNTVFRVFDLSGKWLADSKESLDLTWTKQPVIIHVQSDQHQAVFQWLQWEK